jgi:hypothetical protein
MDFKKKSKIVKQNLSANFDGQNQNSKKMATKKFGIKGQNTTGKDVKIAMFTGTYKNIDEIKMVYPEVDCVMADGVCLTDGTKKVTFASKSIKTIAHLQTYAKRVIAEIRNVDIVTDDKENFQQDILFAETDPFDGRPGFTEKRISKHVSTMQNDGLRAVCNGVNIPMNPGSLVILTLCANSKVDITMDVAMEN